MNLSNVKKSLPVLLNVGITPLLIGDAGVGKTESVSQFCKENGFEMISIRLGQLSDASDLIGLYDFKMDDKGNKVSTKLLMPNYLHEALENAKKGKKFIIFLDEINRSHKDLIQSIFELVYDKKISCNGFYIPEGSGVIAAMNPSTDDYDVLDFNDAAFNDRFCHIKVEATVSEWLTYARDQKVSHTITSFIAEQNGMLETKRPDFSLDVTPSRRSWFIADRLETICQEDLFTELLMGLVGVEAATGYVAFKRDSDKIVSAEDVLNDYRSVQDKIKELSTDEGHRGDLISTINDALFDIFRKETDKKNFITKEQEENLVMYLKDIPVGTFAGFMMRFKIKDLTKKLDFLFTNKEGDLAALGVNDELLEYLKEHKEEINKENEAA